MPLDRKEKSEFFQLQGWTYGEDFFFELIERRGGCRGYGADDARFRLFAQKRELRLPQGSDGAARDSAYLRQTSAMAPKIRLCWNLAF